MTARRHGREGRWRVRLATVAAVIAVATLFVIALYQPWLSQWGSTAQERDSTVAGDDLVPDPDLTWTRSITIDAPAASVWPWVAQMGVDKGGFYNYDWGEQLFGDPVHNATTIHPEWQELAVGDVVHPFPDQDWEVAALREGELLVLANPKVSPTDWTWAIELRPLPDGRTRVVTRIRSVKGTWFSYALDPPDLILFPRLLTGLKQRAEGTLPACPGPTPGSRSRSPGSRCTGGRRCCRWAGSPASPAWHVTVSGSVRSASGAATPISCAGSGSSSAAATCS